MTRLMIEEADTLPAMAKAFYERVMKRGHRHIAETLDRLVGAQAARDIGASEQLAAVVTGAVFGELHIRALLGESSAMSEAEIFQRIDIALNLLFARFESAGSPDGAPDGGTGRKNSLLDRDEQDDR